MDRKRFAGTLVFLLLLSYISPAQAQQPNTNRVKVGILIMNGAYITEFSGPLDVFHHVSPDKIEVYLISDTDKEMKSFEGLPFRANYTIYNAPKLDVLVVPSAIGSVDRDLENKPLINWLQKAASDAKLISSQCQGSFLLATAGLLDGKEATTSGGSLDDFEKRFPTVHVNREDRVVVDGKIISSPGGLSSYESSLYIVRQLFGEAEARDVAKKLEFTPTNVNASLVGK